MSPDSEREIRAASKQRQNESLHDLYRETGHRAPLLHTMGILLCIAAFVFVVGQLLFWSHPDFGPPPWTDLLLEALVVVAGPLTLWFVRSGRLRSAAWTVLSLLIVGSAFQLVIEGRPPTDVAGSCSLLLTVAVAFVLLERRSAWFVTSASAIFLVAVHALWWRGLLPPPVSRDRSSQLLFSLTSWIVPATILAAILSYTMNALLGQARNLQGRVKELTLLHEVGKRITGMLDLDTLLDTAAQSLRQGFGYHSVVILTLDEGQETLIARAVAGQLASILPQGHAQDRHEGLIGWAARRAETVLVNDVSADPRYVNRYPQQIDTQSELCVPIRIGDNVAGVLDVQSDHRGAFDTSDRMVLETLAGQIAGAMENARLYQAERAAHHQVRDLVTYLQNAREKERTHIAREMLDEFGQLMAALQMDLSWLVTKFPDDQPHLTEKAEEMSDVIDASLGVVRDLSGQLRPSVLDHFGVASAIRWQAEAFSQRSNIAHRLQLDKGTDLMDPELSTALFRILQDSLTNVERHAGATEVHIDLHVDREQAALVVADNGRGITPEEMSGPRSLGLAGMRQRARALGGQLVVKGVPGQGTTVTATIPRNRPGLGRRT